MINSIKLFLNNLDNKSAISYARSYFNVNLSEEEVKQVLPLLQDSFEDYLNPATKQLFINRMIAASSEETANKVLIIAKSLKGMFGIA